MKKLLPYIISLVYLLVGQMGLAMAQSEDFGSGALGGLVTASTRDVFDIVVGIVNIVLYFLGGIAVLLGLYAGWLWFTSRGNADQIKKAKGIMVSAVIGLAIIFASYAITNFVIDNLYRNTIGSNDNVPGDDGGGDDGSGTNCPPPADGSMLICSYSPAKPVGGYVTITGWNFGDYDEGASQVTINGVPAPMVSCASRRYWDRRLTNGTSVSYRVKVIVPEVPVGGPYEIKLQNTIAGEVKEVTNNGFHVLTGTAGLNIACIEPVASGRNTDVVAYGINFGTTGNRVIRMSSWTGSPAAVAPINAIFDLANWSDTQINFTIPNEALTSDVYISNDSNIDKEYFRVSCANADECASGCCNISRNSCVSLNVCNGTVEINGPHINHITPDNGTENNLVTIQGSGFGSSGRVIFTDATGATTDAKTPKQVYDSCSNLWTDTEIIVGVPLGDPVAERGTYSVSVLPSSSTVPSNSYTFNVNGTTRPGICAADKNTGSFGTAVTITGVNFVRAIDNTNTVKYGGVADNNTNISVPNVANSTVPNLQKGLVGIQINAGTEMSNPFSFAITEAMAGEPSIVNIDPIAGPAGTYVTINGTNFGSSRGAGNVFFDDIAANFSFPLQCSNSIWSSSRIMVKVPSGLISARDYNIKVVRSDSKESNTKIFTANTDPLKPGLCAIYPDNGQKITTQVSFYGDNFGTSKGESIFYNGQSTTTGPWDNNKALYARVPGEAESGPVSIRNSDGQVSNALNFRVGSCSRDSNCNTEIGEKCCTNSIGNYCATSCSNARMCYYGWSFTTEPTAPEALSVEDHWPACDSSCGNAAIGLTFNVQMGASAEVPTNYTVLDTTDNTVVTVTPELIQNTGELARVNLRYPNTVTLAVGHTYRVTVGTNIFSVDNENLAEAYFWEFKVGSGSCDFTSVDITPKNFTATTRNQIINYDAAPTAAMGSCGIQRLNCGAGSCNYTWSIDASPVVANIESGGSTASMNAKSTYSITPPTLNVADNVHCSITKAATPTISASASTGLSIDYRASLESLIVTDWYPNCDNACSNAIVGLHFSSALDVSTAVPANFQIFDVSNNNLDVTQSVVSLLNDTANPNSESVWQIVAPLTNGHTYRVLISKNIKNFFGNSLSRDFTWNFTVGSAECVVTGATVSPANFTANSIGQNKKYRAMTVSRTASCGTIPVNCTNCSYQWSSSANNVATVTLSSTNEDIATVAPTAVSGSSTNISCQVTLLPNTTLPLASGVLNVELTGTSYTPPVIETFMPPVGLTPQCRNVAIEILFSQKMNLDSIKNNLKLYNSSNVAIAGTYSFATVNRSKTKVVFSPTELLVAGNEYRVAAGPGIIGINNQALSFTNYPSLDPAAQAWKFTIGNEVCEISFVRTVPPSDWFSCGGNTCEGDDHTGTQSGNQHDYFATPYSRQGTAISDVGITYAWRVSPNANSVSLTGANLKTVIATAEENGQSAVSVTATNVSSVSASASLPVTVSLCEHPWPSISTFPWVENALNFSSYYCQQIDDNNISLPMLGEPSATLPASNPDILAGKILKEYIFPVNITTGTNTETNFIIFRVMPNVEHLSVKEWYKNKFPGDALGTMTTVDGYEAMKVGNTIYISAANIDIVNSKIHTNIYIIAYSIGANAQTKNIYDQFIANFKLNTNAGFSNSSDDNLCSTDRTKFCSSDLDCPATETCGSRSLKLRRDVKRVTDLLPVQKYLNTYGATHMACSGNSQLSCSSNAQCGSFGTCVNYYPQLNAGTFVSGKTNSKWPSWQQTFATDLKQTLPLDPINKFSTCPVAGADPETCWNETTTVEANKFQCADNSYIYGYVLEGNGKDYQLYSNFEYDPLAFNGVTFYDELNNGGNLGINAIGNISTDLSDYCSVSAVPPGTRSCGNGRVDPGEDCDGGGINYAQCSLILDPHPWWNEQVSGCNAPGTTNECKWYRPVLTPAMCGGYCGDGALQTSYENCDAGRYNGRFSCPAGGAVSCNASSCNAVCADGLAAAKCGDGILTPLREACDTSANPNGLAGWDCPNNGNVRCTSCGITCDNSATPYQGRCGNGTIEGSEVCDYGNYSTKSPAVADNSPLCYTCSQSCNFVDQRYCGDNILQLSYGEECDTNPLTTILPAQSSKYKQYQCRTANDTTVDPKYTRCTLTTGGYCGDGITQDGTGGTYNAGEKCDPLGYTVAPGTSSITHQYICTAACQTNGGYCGDGIYNSAHEECDNNAGLSGWGCTLGGTISCNACGRTCSVGVPYAGQCGNNIVEAPEQCDGNEVACNVISPTLYVGGYASCNVNSCATGSTGGCCTTNNLSAKFMVDNSFNLFVNGVKIGTGSDWQTCVNGEDTPYDAATLDDGGACEFNVNDTNLFNYDHAENVVAFTATDTGVAAGVVGTFSCQAKTCRRVCYQGSNAGAICEGGATCPGGTCIIPTVATGTSCDWNSQCVGSGQPSTVSLCLPSDYGITTKVNNSLWRCTDVAPSGDTWKSTGFIENSTWRSPESAPTGSSVTNWWGANQVYNWKHMVPGAEPIWLGGIGSVAAPRTIYCRYVIRGYDSSLPTPDLEKPSNPANLSASAAGNQISLTWSASTDNVTVTGYNIFRSITNGSGYTKIGTSNTTSYVDSGLQNRIYYYVVQAYDATGNVSGNSNQASATVDTSAPTTPTGLTATVAGTQVSLSWSASTDNIAVTGYNIFRSTVNGGPYALVTTSIPTSYVETLSLGTYYYIVQAYDASGNTSGNSSQVVAIMDIQAPSVPQNIQASPANNRVNLSWVASTDPEGSVVTYIIERASTISGPFVVVATVGTVSYPDTGLSNGTQYFYQIKARDTSNNQSAYSTPVVSATPDNNTVAPNAPTLLSIIANSALKTMSLSWAAPLSGPLVVSYIIERSLTSAFDNFVTVGTSVGTSIVDNFSDLLPGVPQIATNYWYRVRAVGTLGLQSLPLVGSMLFPDNIAPTPAPSALTARFMGTSVALTWTGSSDNVGVTNYVIQRSTAVAGPFNTTVIGATTSYSDSSFAANTTYYYQVAARDATGNTSTYSAQVAVLTRDTEAPTPAPILTGTDTDPIITLSWTGTITDNVAVTNYIVQRSNLAAGPFNDVVGATPVASPWQDTTATAGSTYYYRVAAQDAAGNRSVYSNIDAATAFDGPGQPTISNINVGIFAVSFVINSTGGVNPRTFTIERAPISAPSNFTVLGSIAALTVGATPYTDSTVLGSTTYYYRVKCTDANGTISAYSDTATANTLDSTPPVCPGPFTAASSAGSITLSWPACTDNIAMKGYVIERSINGAAYIRLPNTSSPITTTDTTYVDSTVGGITGTPSISYRFRPVDTSDNTTGWTTRPTYVCNVAYCDQYDADPITNCMNSCTAVGHCCQPCYSMTSTYLGCQVIDPARTSCQTVTLSSGTCR